MSKQLFFVASLLFIGIFLLSQCSSSSKFYTPTTANVSSKATLDELAKGRELLMTTCAQCHRAPAPRKHDAEGWKPTLLRMQEKAQISDANRELIYKYLTSEKI